MAFGILFSIGAIPGALSPIIFGWIGDFYGLQASVIFLVMTTLLATIFALLLREFQCNNKMSSTLMSH
ncbi:MAG: hypothetical protein ACXABV_20095 [Candidatus Thorarchaeota archaeon]